MRLHTSAQTAPATRILFLLMASVLLAATPASAIKINEIRIDQPGGDVDEYFEIIGTPGASLDGLTYVVIGDGTGGSGVIETAASLDGQSIQPSGFFTGHKEGTVGTCAVYDAELPMSFENGDNVTHLIVEGFTGAVGDDVDVDDDGNLDNAPWTSTLDCVALLDSDPDISGDQVYCDTRVGPDTASNLGHVYLCAGGWEIGPFENCTQDTPGAANAFCGLPAIVNVAQVPLLVTPDDVVTISADISDPNGTIVRAQLKYESSAGASQMPDMTNVGGDTYEATIPAKPLGVTVWWYIEVEDNDGNVVTDPPDAPTARHEYTVQDPPPPTIVINEFMANPAVLADSEGEWFEVYNATLGPIDMNGWTITDEGIDSHVIDNGGPLVIEAGEYQVFARDAVAMGTQGVTVFYEYSGVNLANSADEIILVSPAKQSTVAQVNYDTSAGWTITAGASLQFGFHTNGLPKTDNPNDPGCWGTAGAPFGDGDKGTPGGSNDFVTPAPELVTPRTQLYGNHPNPFNPSTTFSFSLGARQHVRLAVYNVRGQIVRVIVDRMLDAGRHDSFRWDGRGDDGQSMPSGAYYYRLVADDGAVQTHKMTLVK